MKTDLDPAVRIVSLGEEQGDDVAALMGRAFQDDPLVVHACPDSGDRARWLPWMWRWSTWKGFLFGQTLGTAGRLDGVVAMIAPAAGEFTDEDLARFGYLRGRDSVGAAVWDRAIDRMNPAFDPADAALHRAVPEPHWYLDVIAVDPVAQGRGVGGALLRAASARADADGVPIVLLTFQPKNLAFYTRYGYAIVCEGASPQNGPQWWGLRRNPGT
jgi:ribosomal protein S18 acetylase RimI-like enzyme